ncbi:MAG: signal recognition particle receptor subunit alpha, partial [Pseudomonadota bacterium]|nr:signal recognition particle receptor subunit alpha [Pseudomonadota bacterium]
MSGLFGRLRAGLSRSSKALGDSLGGLLGGSRLSAEQLDTLEDLLIMADLGVEAAGEIVETLRQRKDLKDLDEAELRAALATEIAALLAPAEHALDLPGGDTPRVIVMAGVNGAGKTTTIGKLAKRFQDESKSVMLAACDTYRAAAGEQLQIWGERAGVPVVSATPGSDAAGLAFKAFEQAIAQEIDILIVDTAGRLQSNAALMAELGKIIRVLGKLDADAPHA